MLFLLWRYARLTAADNPIDSFLYPWHTACHPTNHAGIRIQRRFRLPQEPMSDAGFAHLHLHSEYSLLDGAIRLGPLIKKAKEYGMPAVSLTDHGTMFGAIEFYTKCKDAGVRPVIGAEVYIAPDSRHNRTYAAGMPSNYHLILLCENLEGYKNLSRLVSAGYKEGFYRKPRIDKELLAAHTEGLICLSACLKGEVAHYCLLNRMEEAVAVAREYHALFPGSYYIELQENTMEEQTLANNRLMEVARELGLPLVATNDCHYLNRDDARAHEILLCLQTGKTLSDPNHMKFSADEFYFKSPDEMRAAFHYAPEAVSNTVAVAERCNLELDFKTYHFPQYEKPADKTLDELLEEQAYEGLKERLVTVRAKYPDLTAEQEQAYYDRLRIELDCIKQMGFPGYFLIVADFINWAKDHDIPVGPGRGSAAGSLVAYAIRITDLDPIPYNLLFERFLNPERISMPDIDVDFCQDRRDEVIQYVAEKYGRDRVCQIITFGKMKAKAVVRDVGRVLDMTYGDVDRIAKLVPDVLDISLEKAIKQEPKLQELADTDPRVRELLDAALCLEGLSRHASTHAAGVVVAPQAMEEYCPVYKDQKSGSVTTQYSMKYVEKIGLVKFDFLGLKNLTVIDNAVRLIRSGQNPAFDITTLRDDDQETYKLLQSGNTTGVFQLESSGMQGLLVKLKPSCFEDIIAVCALYRPGPLGSGMVDDFIDRKHGRKEVVYDLPQLEPILKDTYGVIVYQEQVMQISRSLAGYSLGGADLLRRAMGKKDPAVMAKEKIPFLDGAKAQGIDPKKAEAIFDLMAKFAEYGFNKSHSAAYALVAYQTAYLKAHYPVEFLAALLTEDMGNSDKVVKNISDCRDMGIDVLPPDINASDLSFRVLGSSIRFGLGAVKNVGEGAIEAILESRRDGEFRDIFDFCERVDLRRVNKRVVESLIKCGAFDSTGANRAQLMAGLEDAMNYGQKIQQERDSAQVSLFGTEEIVKGNGNGGVKLPNVHEWDEKLKLGFEKEALGFFITGHPLDRYATEIKRFASVFTSDFDELSEKTEVRVCGIIVAKKEFITKKGDRMAFLTLEDLHGTIEVVVLAKVFARVSEFLSSEDPLLVTGTVEVGEKNRKLMAEDVVLLRELAERETKRVTLNMTADKVTEADLESLRDIIIRYRGGCPVFLALDVPDAGVASIRLPEAYSVIPSEELSLEVKRLFGYNAASFE